MAGANYRPGSQHPEEYRRYPNPDALEGENRAQPRVDYRLWNRLIGVEEPERY